jgi:hypothetical protein
MAGPESYDMCNSELKWDGPLTPEERKLLEQKVSLTLGWVGTKVPASVEIDGKPMPLHDLVWNLLKKDAFSDDEKQLILDLEAKLEKKFRADVLDLRERDSTDEQAETHYCEALGLMRAIVTLKNMTSGDNAGLQHRQGSYLTGKMAEQRRREASRWLDLLKQIRN